MRKPLTCLLGGALTVTAFLAISAAQGAELPALPKAIQDKGEVVVGTKCDYPPEGYLDASGKAIGIEVEMAHQIAAYAFGKGHKAKIVCVTGSNRVPSLVGGKIDLIIATMGITAKRAEVVDFTKPYAWTASSVMVMKDSPIKTLDDLKDKKIIFIKGAWQVPWFEKHYPKAEQMRLNTVSEAVQALMQGRADAYAHDLPVQMDLAVKNNRVRLLDARYNIGLRGAAVRPGEKEWLAFINASLAKMHKDKLFEKWIRQFVEPEQQKLKLSFWDMDQLPKK